MLIKLQQQGKQANSNGKNFEDQVISRIAAAGYYQIKSESQNHGDKYFVPQYKLCNGIYGTQLKTDILLFDKIKYPLKLAIEIKWQQTSGSVDEKYPYLVINIKKMFPCPAIIIIDGGGYKEGALNWLKGQIDNKLIGVYDLSGFLKWANSGGI